MSDQELKDIIQGILCGTDAEENDVVRDALVALVKHAVRLAEAATIATQTGDKQWQATTA